LWAVGSREDSSRSPSAAEDPAVTSGKALAAGPLALQGFG
jgi:hypothetical protein